MDGGWGWCVLIATFTAQLLYAGAVPNVGIYLVEWQEYFGVGAATVSIIATELTMGIQVTGIFSGALCQRLGCRFVMIVGGAIGMIGSFLMSFSTQLWHLHILSVISGMGYGIAYFPTMIVIRFYFNKRLGFANGFTYAGIGAGFFVMAPLIETLCSEYGWKGALMIHAAINANFLVCGLILRRTKMEQRIMNSYRTKPPTAPQELDGSPPQSLCARFLRSINETFAISKLVRNPCFVALCLVSILTFSSHISVLIFTAPKLVRDLGLSKTTASLVMSTYGITSLLARALHGFLLDFKLISVTNIYLVALVLSGIHPMVNPLVTSTSGQFVLVVTYGIAAGIMIPTTVLVCRQYVSIDIASSAIGLIIAVGGLGNLLGTQLMGQLCEATGSYDIPFYLSAAFFWISAIVMILVTKCTRFGRNIENTSEADENKDVEPSPDRKGIVKEKSKAIDTSGYQPVPEVDDVRPVIEEDAQV